MKQSNQSMRDTFEGNKVIVFPAASLLPWYHVTRFNFLECNLKEVVDKGIPYKREKLQMKDRFVGNINLLRSKKAATPDRKTDFPEIDAPKVWMIE